MVIFNKPGTPLHASFFKGVKSTTGAARIVLNLAHRMLREFRLAASMIMAASDSLLSGEREGEDERGRLEGGVWARAGVEGLGGMGSGDIISGTGSWYRVILPGKYGVFIFQRICSIINLGLIFFK